MYVAWQFATMQQKQQLDGVCNLVWKKVWIIQAFSDAKWKTISPTEATYV